uniref:DNA-directed RNA polymerase III subunit RPC3 n=1 Tax=Meloidogyne incognita TaxID=6306 RepID=A0A914NME1_MELIC
MSKHLIDVSVAVLEDHFGYYIARIGNLLLREALSLALLARNLAPLKISLKDIRNSLAILDQHNLLTFELGSRSIIYSICPNQVFYLISAPRAILLIKTLYEGVTDAIFEDILAKGRSSCSDCIRRVSKCMDDLPFEKVKSDFSKLLSSQILIRCPQVAEESSEVFPMFQVESYLFLLPDVVLDGYSNAENDSETIKSKTKKLDSDSNILWRVNWISIERLFRDDLILDSLIGGSQNDLFDKTTVKVAQLILKVGDAKNKNNLFIGQSSPISLQDVCRYVHENQLDYNREMLDEKLNIICRDMTGILRRVGDSGGGVYIINYEKGIETLCLEHIESAIREKINDKAVRIFRLLNSRGFLEEEQLEKEAMLSSKETKELCCSLMDYSFITTRQVARANDFAPARLTFLYIVNKSQLLSAVIDYTLLTIRNVIRRRMVEREKYEPLLDRQLKMEVIISSIENNQNISEDDEETKKEQIAEVERAYMTTEDRRNLERFRRAERKFCSAEIELGRLHFALKHFYQLRQQINAEQQRQIATQGKRKRTYQQAHFS